jgi:hypothetical protein
MHETASNFDAIVTFILFNTRNIPAQPISYFERKSTSCHQILPKFRTLKPTMKEVYSIKDARNKIEHYCAYQNAAILKWNHEMDSKLMKLLPI